MKPKPYPSLVCYDCGLRYGLRIPSSATWHKGGCGVCGKWGGYVTEPAHFGHLALDEESKGEQRRGEVSWMRGEAVNCTYCGRRKKPLGRSAPLEMANGMCDGDCPGYDQRPYPGDLWPGETREEFGYPKECPTCGKPVSEGHKEQK